MIRIDIEASRNCINIYSYGTICVGCGCCEREPNKTKRLQNQLEYYKERLEENNHFSLWSDDEEIRKLQEHNVKKNTKYYCEKIKEIEQKLKGADIDG